MYRDIESGLNIQQLHLAIYAGAIARIRDVPEMHAIVRFVRDYVEERLAPHAPIDIHRHFPHEALADLLSRVQQDFSQSRAAKALWLALFEAVGIDPSAAARDRLILRFQPPISSSAETPWKPSTGTIGFHRDSWATNMYAQVNWWAPVYPISAARTFAIFPDLWATPLANNSAVFDMAAAMRRVREDGETRKACEMVPELLGHPAPVNGVPVVIEPGSVIAFSAAHAHAGVKNHTTLTRISLETRTVIISDHLARRGALNIDGYGRWIVPGLFRRLVESRCGAVAVGSSRRLPHLSDSGASIDEPWFRFHIPLIEPDRQFSCIRLSDERSCFRPREVARQ